MMRTILAAMLLLTTVTMAQAQSETTLNFAIAIHGGAGDPPSDPTVRKQRHDFLESTLKQAVKDLESGATALDIVEDVIRKLEDCPLFNAGRGAVFSAAGINELDASIMDGTTRAGGAVGGVKTVKHPISLARRVMTDTRHVLLVADGAEQFADELGADAIKRVDNSYFATEERRQSWEKARQEEPSWTEAEAAAHSRGTVGCVVLDSQGNLAAGTSTGGLTNKKFGRIGDTPILSAGTYADNDTCAVSCTGVGEDFIRYAVAYDVSARMRYQKQPLDDAIATILQRSDRQVRGGVIAVDREGTITMQFNTLGMARAAADSNGRFEVSD